MRKRTAAFIMERKVSVRRVRRRPNQYTFLSEDRKFRRRKTVRQAVLVILVLAVAVVVAFNFIISNHVRLEDVRLTVLSLPIDLENYSILHLSDLHGAVYGEHQKAFKTALSDNRYSCVVMTGDMLGKNGDTGPLLELLALMPRETPKYYVPGDMDGPAVETQAHGSLEVFAPWAVELQKAGVTILDRPVLETRGKKGRIWFVPEELYALDLESMETVYARRLEEMRARATSLTADDAAAMRAIEYDMERLAAVREMKKEFLPTDIQIVLTHTPLSADYVDDQISWSAKEEAFSLRYASLILAGHYNNGQWRIPFVGAVYVPELGWLPEDQEITGLNYLHGIPQYISPGLGSDPHYERQPGRVFNPPVVTRIFLTRKAT